MMNNSLCTTPTRFHRELSFGSWKVSFDRSPQRISHPVTDFGIGMRWAGLGVIASLVALVAAAL